MGGKGSGRKPLHPCGTWAAYQRHLKNGSTPCELCRQAARLQHNKRYKPKGVKNAWRVNAKAYVRREKVRRGACLDCGLECKPDNTFVFDFDHRNPHEKKFALAQAVTRASKIDLDAEMAKCDLVCANCHRHRTQKQYNSKILTGFRKDDSLRVDSLTLFD